MTNRIRKREGLWEAKEKRYHRIVKRHGDVKLPSAKRKSASKNDKKREFRDV